MGQWKSVLLCILRVPLTMSLLAAFALPCTAQKLHLDPQYCKIGSFFSGTQLRVSAQTPEGAAVVIEIQGENVEQELMRKGRRWELWMNVGEVDIEGAPRLYLVASSNPELLQQPAGTVPWGYEALRERADFRGLLNQSERTRIFDEFVRLKTSHGLYGSFPGAVKISSSAESGSIAEAVFQLNSRISPGSYRACLWTVRNGLITKQECAPFAVAMVGVPAFLSTLAMKQPLFYGLLAVAMGAILGLLSGILFKRKREEQQR